MRITFVVPSFVPVPVGGIKVVYHHANLLAERGHEVTLLEIAATGGAGSGRAARLRRDARLAFWRRGIGGWFRLDRTVRTGSVRRDRPEELPAADAIVAAGWVAAAVVNEAPSRAGRRHYLVQGYMAAIEGEPGEVDASWRLPLRKIVISRWLEQRCRELGVPQAEVVRIPAAVDEQFRVMRAPETRQPGLISVLHHPAPAKGFDTAVAALSLARDQQPEVRVIAFGTEQPLGNLPDWIEFRLLPDVAALHNECAVHLHASRLEGWPLAAAEAMACGSALVGAANQGLLEFAIHEHNALLAAPADVESLAAALVRLIEDRELRLRIARTGAQDMAGYDWSRASLALESVLAGFA